MDQTAANHKYVSS